MAGNTVLSILIIVACTIPVAAQTRRKARGSRIIPVCPIPTDTEKLVGFDIKFIVPKDTNVHESRDIDYVAWAINLGPQTNPMQLTAFSGLNVGNGEPSREHIAESLKLSRRYWSHGDKRGVDSRGTFKNGKLWRIFGMFGEVVWYHKVSAETAAQLDRVLDTACFVD